MTCENYRPWTALPQSVVRSAECSHFEWWSGGCELQTNLCEYHGWPPGQAQVRQSFGVMPEEKEMENV